MQIRPATASDLSMLIDIDGTIESTQYLHLEMTGDGLEIGMNLQPRPLHAKLIASNPIADETSFLIKQIATGADDWIVLVADHDQVVVALALAQPRPELGTMQLIELRVDYDHRRQGLATAMVYQIVHESRDRELRAVFAEVPTNNFPANQMLQKLGFELSGIDTRRRSNHDKVKEMTTLLWYSVLE